jgi:hypothetical protein
MAAVKAVAIQSWTRVRIISLLTAEWLAQTGFAPETRKSSKRLLIEQQKLMRGF